MLEHTIVTKISAVQRKKSDIVIAFCGAADLGKSYLSRKVVESLQRANIDSSHLTLDSFLMDRAEREKRNISGYDIRAHDIQRVSSILENWKQGKDISFKPYNHKTGSKSHEYVTINKTQVLIIDGLFSMCERFLSEIDLSFFIYTDDKKLKHIKLEADLIKRGYSPEYSEKIYEKEFILYKKNVEPFKAKASFKLHLKEKWKYEIEEKDDQSN